MILQPSLSAVSRRIILLVAPLSITTRTAYGGYGTCRGNLRRLAYIDTLRGSGVYGEIVVTVVVLVVAFIDFVEDISDLSYLSHVAAILFRKVRALAEEMDYVTAAYLFAKWTSLRDSGTPVRVKW